MAPLDRRDFMKATAAGAITVSQVARAAGDKSPNEQLRIGVIGCGNISNNHVGALIRLADEDNIALDTLCDIYESRAESYAERVKDRGGKAKVVTDYRSVLDDKDIDVVVICVPEHAHHYICMDALDAGKHVYCEKPLCYDVTETKEVVAKVNETGLKLQVGIQGMADDSYPSALAAIQAGKLGPVVQAQIEFVRNHKLDQGPWRKDLSKQMDQPGDLDWPSWLHPRPERAWDPHLYHEWRCYKEFSGGIATDLFVHRVARIMRACGLGFPMRAAALGGIYMWEDGRDTPDNMEMILEYGAVEGVTPGMTVHLLGTMSNDYKIDHCIRGHKATLVFTGKGWNIVDERSNEVTERYEKIIGEDMSAHHVNHHASIREGAELNCPAEFGLQTVVAARMGNLSWENKKMVAWNDAEQTVVVS